MEFFQPNLTHTLIFAVIMAFVVVTTTYIFWLENPKSLPKVVGFWTVWSALHFLLAHFGVFYSTETPQIVVPYFLTSFIFGIWVALGRIGKTVVNLRSAQLLLAMQAFRIPLEFILHALYEDGNIPIQMTWSGWNLDVISGVVGLIVLVIYLVKKDVPTIVLGIANTIGFVLIIAVMVIAVSSAPGPLRQFANDPPLILIFVTPWTWIASIAVWSAFVSHLIVFRSLWVNRHGT